MVGGCDVVIVLGAGGVEGGNMSFEAAQHNAVEATPCFGATHEEGTTLTRPNPAGPPIDRLPYHIALGRDVKDAEVGDSWHPRRFPE